MPSSSSGARVTRFHEQILKVALLPIARTGDEWAKLMTRPEDLWAPDTRQLLPLLSRALVDARIDDPVVPRLMHSCAVGPMSTTSGRSRSSWRDVASSGSRLSPA